MSLTPVLVLLRFVFNRLEVVLIIHGQHAAEGVGAKVFDEGSRDLVAVFEQQSFELDGILERTAVGHHAGGIDQRILTDARGNLLAGAPLADGIVLVQGQSQRIDVAVAGGTVRVLARALQFSGGW